MLLGAGAPRDGSTPARVTTKTSGRSRSGGVIWADVTQIARPAGRDRRTDARHSRDALAADRVRVARHSARAARPAAERLDSRLGRRSVPPRPSRPLGDANPLSVPRHARVHRASARRRGVRRADRVGDRQPDPQLQRDLLRVVRLCRRSDVRVRARAHWARRRGGRRRSDLRVLPVPRGAGRSPANDDDRLDAARASRVASLLRYTIAAGTRRRGDRVLARGDVERLLPVLLRLRDRGRLRVGRVANFARTAHARARRSDGGRDRRRRAVCADCNQVLRRPPAVRARAPGRRHRPIWCGRRFVPDDAAGGRGAHARRAHAFSETVGIRRAARRHAVSGLRDGRPGSNRNSVGAARHGGTVFVDCLDRVCAVARARAYRVGSHVRDRRPVRVAPRGGADPRQPARARTARDSRVPRAVGASVVRRGGAADRPIGARAIDRVRFAGRVRALRRIRRGPDGRNRTPRADPR